MKKNYCYPEQHSSKQHEALYLMHGYDGGIRTIFEGTTNGRILQNMVDHLIADGRMRPTMEKQTVFSYYN